MSPTKPPGSGWVLPGAVALALLVVVLTLGVTTGLAAVDGSSQAAMVPVDNTTAYLQPEADGQSRERVDTVPLDASVAVTTDAHGLHGRFERQSFDDRYGAAETQGERAALFGRHVSDLTTRIEALTDARYAATGGHSRGEVSTDEFLRTLARIDAASERAQAFRGLLQNRSVLAGTARSHQTTLRNLQVDLATLRSPALTQLRDRLGDGADAGSVYVGTVGDRGLVVATVGDGQYRREALDGGERDPGGLNRFTNRSEVGIGVAYERASRLYPWIFRENVAPGPATRYGNTSVYSITVDHSQGRLSTYLDGATENVFREVQEKRLSVLPLQPLGTDAGDRLRVSVNGTHPTGPLLVRVTDPASGEPIDSTLVIDGVRVGSTGADGERWTIQPEGAFTVNATSGGESITLTLP